jgi:hypothetical protein
MAQKTYRKETVLAGFNNCYPGTAVFEKRLETGIHQIHIWDLLPHDRCCGVVGTWKFIVEFTPDEAANAKRWGFKTKKKGGS